VNPPEPSEELIEKIDPKPLDELTEEAPQKGAIYLCMECAEEFEEGKKARGHACQNEHRNWIRHTKLPSNWNYNPYKLVAQSEAVTPNAY